MSGELSDLVDELRERMAVVRRGGSESARQKHLDRGKLLVRDRVDRLLDPGSPFLELNPLAAFGMYGPDGSDGDEYAVPAASIVTGIGRINGRECVVVANDATVKGGTYYPMTVKKHLRAQQVAPTTSCRASTSSTPAAPSCRCRTRCSPTASTSAGSSSTRPTSRRAASRRSPR